MSSDRASHPHGEERRAQCNRSDRPHAPCAHMPCGAITEIDPKWQSLVSEGEVLRYTPVGAMSVHDIQIGQIILFIPLT